jgi:hypothetical protein
MRFSRCELLLLEAVTRQRLMKTLQAGKDIACAVVKCSVC